MLSMEGKYYLKATLENIKIMSRETIDEYNEQVWNARNVDKVDEVFDKDAVIHSPLGEFQTPKDMKEVIKVWLNAIPDIQVEFLNTIEEKNFVVSHWKASGTHKGKLFGIEGTNRPLTYSGASIFRFRDGKVIEYWAYLESESIKKQIQ